MSLSRGRRAQPYYKNKSWSATPKENATSSPVERKGPSGRGKFTSFQKRGECKTPACHWLAREDFCETCIRRENMCRNRKAGCANKATKSGICDTCKPKVGTKKCQSTNCYQLTPPWDPRCKSCYNYYKRTGHNYDEPEEEEKPALVTTVPLPESVKARHELEPTLEQKVQPVAAHPQQQQADEETASFWYQEGLQDFLNSYSTDGSEPWNTSK